MRSAVEALKPLNPPSLLSETAALSSENPMHRPIEFHAGSTKSNSYNRAWQRALLGSRSEALTVLEQGCGTQHDDAMIAADTQS
jgi:hypothetical protein